ncbi:MAG: hypothetical protein J7K64_00915 [Bacteroidales bacterium]|nr:hypothetical protein [Bacteroidales bacterium]
MNSLNYPLKFTFKIGTLSNDFTAKDADDHTIAYVRQKLFKLKEQVIVYSDEKKTSEKYYIKANKWLDFNTAYSFTTPEGTNLGKVARKGWKSLWKAKYELYDENDQQDLVIEEENPFAKVMDAMFSEIPVLGMFTGYVFNPKYTVKRPDGMLVARVAKEKSFFGRRFSITKLADFEQGEETRILLGSMMMLLLERRRG